MLKNVPDGFTRLLLLLSFIGFVTSQALNCAPVKPAEEPKSEVVADAASEPKSEPLPDVQPPEERSVEKVQETLVETPPQEAAPDEPPVVGPPKVVAVELLPGGSLANVVADTKGGPIFAGSHGKGSTFAGVTFAEAGFHVLKRDAAGKVAWTFTAEGTGVSQVSVAGMVVDKADQVTLIGEYDGKIAIAGKEVPNQDSDNSFVLRLDNTGKVLWFKIVKKGLFGDSLHSIALDATGAALITGQCQFNCTFGNTTLKPVGKSDMFLAKMDDKGSFVWAISAGGAEDDRGLQLALDAANNIYLVGTFSGDATFGTTSLKARFEGDTFVAMLDKDGKFLWVQAPTHMLRGSEVRSIEISAKGALYIAGVYRGFLPFIVAETDKSPETSVRPFLAKLDDKGKPSWVKSIQGGSSSAHGGMLDKDEHFYLTGSFKGTLFAGKQALTSTGKFDTFIAKYDQDGAIVWTLALGADAEIFTKQLSRIPGGDLFVTASFFDSFKMGPFSIQVPANGSGSFVVQLQ